MDRVAAFAERHPEVAAWFTNSTFDFAIAMHDAVVKYGNLTPRQLEASQRCAAQFKAAQERQANAPAADVSAIAHAFDAATANGLKRPKLTLGDLRFSLAPVTGINAGAIYVKQSPGGIYLGKFHQGCFVRSRDCDEAQQATILAIGTDPYGAAVNHGKLTGNCAVCSRPLSDPASVARGIGPICAAKLGWS